DVGHPIFRTRSKRRFTRPTAPCRQLFTRSGRRYVHDPRRGVLRALGCTTLGIRLIVLSELTKSYGDRVAVQDLTFRVAPGEIYVLPGAKGAGRTTALRGLATLLTPTTGTAVIAGHDVREEPKQARSKLGFLSASMGLYERLSAREL